MMASAAGFETAVTPGKLPVAVAMKVPLAGATVLDAGIADR